MSLFCCLLYELSEKSLFAFCVVRSFIPHTAGQREFCGKTLLSPLSACFYDFQYMFNEVADNSKL